MGVSKNERVGSAVYCSLNCSSLPRACRKQVWIGIGPVLVRLQPVARVVDLVGQQPVALRIDPAVVDRKIRHLLGRAHIGEDEAGIFAGRIGAVAELVPDPAARRFARRVQDRPVHVVVPAVIAAAYATLLDEAVFERGVAVAAAEMQQPDPPAEVAEQDQLLVQDTDRQRQLAELGRQRDRVPESPQVLPARRAPTDMGELGILTGAAAAVIAAEFHGSRVRRGHPRSSAVRIVGWPDSLLGVPGGGQGGGVRSADPGRNLYHAGNASNGDGMT